MAKHAQRKGSFLSRAFTKNSERKRKDWRDQLPVYYQSLLQVQQPGKPVWTPRDYGRFSQEGYIENVVAYRSVALIAQSAASVSWKLTKGYGGGRAEITDHPALSLICVPNHATTGAQFMEALASYRLLSGNAYILMVSPESNGGRPKELHLLRPDRVTVIARKDGTALAYDYTVGGVTKRYPINRITGRSPILHLRNFHPTNDYYGLSPVEAASISIDQHNESMKWNQSLLQNGAKPSGALVVNMAQDGSGGTLSEEQYLRIKRQMEEEFMGSRNAGRPILLEGGLDWKEMSLSPRDMDFIASKNGAARDIALAFGVPPQLLGIPGDNTYNNLVEARLALWEQTILPYLDTVADAFNQWLLPLFGEGLRLSYDEEKIGALTPRREALWARVNNAAFLTDDENDSWWGWRMR